MRKMLCFALLLCMALPLMACESQTPTTQTPQQEDTTDTEEQETTGEDTSDSTSDEEESTGDSQEGNAAYDEFKSTLQSDPTYHVRYEITRGEGDNENVTINTKDGQTHLKIKADEELTVWLNGESYAQYQGNCVELSVVKSAGYDPESIYKDTSVTEGSIKTEDAYKEISSAGTKTVAGKTTDCYELIYEKDDYSQKTTYCMTEDGIPAYIKTMDQDAGELVTEAVATDIATSVDEGILEPCEPNVDLSGYQ